jgi:hypothetical protein
MYYKVLGTTSYVNENAVAVDLGRVDSDAERGIVQAGTCERVELPAVPGTAQNERIRDVVTRQVAR